MKKRNHRQLLSTMAALVLLSVFGISIFAVLLTGAGTYRRITQRDRAAYDRRTCAQYVATKVWQAPSPAGVALEEFGGSDALVIRHELEGAAYLNRIYCHDGWLMELFAAANGEFAPEDGEKVLPADGLMLTRTGEMLLVDIVRKGEIIRVSLCLHDGRGEAA